MRSGKVRTEPQRRHRHHGGVASEPGRREHGQGRGARMANRPLRRAVNAGSHASCGLDRVPGAQQVLPELLGRQLVGAAVNVAVHPDLMAPARRLAGKVLVTPGDPAQEEHRGAMPARREQIEEAAERRLDPRDITVPARRVGVLAVPADVKPVLGVDRQNARTGSGGAKGRDLEFGHEAGILVGCAPGDAFPPWDGAPRPLAPVRRRRAAASDRF